MTTDLSRSQLGSARYFFQSFAYWKLEPVAPYILAESGVRYVVYLPNGGKRSAALATGRYRVRRYDPLTGRWSDAGTAEGGGDWSTPDSAKGVDVAYLLEKL